MIRNEFIPGVTGGRLQLLGEVNQSAANGREVVASTTRPSHDEYYGQLGASSDPYLPGLVMVPGESGVVPGPGASASVADTLKVAPRAGHGTEHSGTTTPGSVNSYSPSSQARPAAGRLTRIQQASGAAGRYRWINFTAAEATFESQYTANWGWQLLGSGLPSTWADGGSMPDGNYRVIWAGLSPALSVQASRDASTEKSVVHVGFGDGTRLGTQLLFTAMVGAYHSANMQESLVPKCAGLVFTTPGGGSGRFYARSYQFAANKTESVGSGVDPLPYFLDLVVAPC